MTYLSDKTKSNKKYVKYIFLMLGFAIFVYFWTTIQIKIHSITTPFVNAYVGTKKLVINTPYSIGLYFSSRNEMESKIKSLETTIERLENEVSEKDAILRENNFVKENTNNDSSATLVLYPVLRDISTMYSTILLSKGYKDGVEEKSVVYLRGHQPVCVISLVYDKTSVCKLLSGSGVKTEGVVASSSITLSLVGAGGGSFMAEVVRGTNINIGDKVYLASNPAMILGEVVEVFRNEQATSWVVYVRGKYNPSLSSIFYITK